jgi:hypothetical protein
LYQEKSGNPAHERNCLSDWATRVADNLFPMCTSSFFHQP